MSKKPFKKPSFFGGPKFLFIAIIILVGLLFVLTQLTDYASNISDLTYKEFLDKVRTDQVQSVLISGQQVEGVFNDGKRFQANVVPREKDIEILDQHGVDYSVASADRKS